MFNESIQKAHKMQLTNSNSTRMEKCDLVLINWAQTFEMAKVFCKKLAKLFKDSRLTWVMIQLLWKKIAMYFAFCAYSTSPCLQIHFWEFDVISNSSCMMITRPKESGGSCGMEKIGIVWYEPFSRPIDGCHSPHAIDARKQDTLMFLKKLGFFHSCFDLTGPLSWI